MDVSGHILQPQALQLGLRELWRKLHAIQREYDPHSCTWRRGASGTWDNEILPTFLAASFFVGGSNRGPLEP